MLQSHEQKENCILLTDLPCLRCGRNLMKYAQCADSRRKDFLPWCRCMTNDWIFYFLEALKRNDTTAII